MGRATLFDNITSQERYSGNIRFPSETIFVHAFSYSCQYDTIWHLHWFCVPRRPLIRHFSLSYPNFIELRMRLPVELVNVSANGQ